MSRGTARPGSIPYFNNYRVTEINLMRLVDLVGELQRSKRYSSSLSGRVEEELEWLCRYVKNDSKTALAYKRTINWGEIEKAAKEDYFSYGAGIYYAIAYLAHSAEKAWKRWSNNAQPQLLYWTRYSQKSRSA
jgi:hypothetical protein